ncbi:nucleotidyl transferase AbiEii/AbiGii toxin family protein [Candidatus Poriferisodalis sp.]|uniref:nucleotidyl transferase AbiEii/AbiGii toxin family protein n=1 Tax=Candidatus Poriferisodalis sp. TaxID=3101277 RepID=UPI003B02354C
MPGDHVVLHDSPDGSIGAFVETLAQFPAEPQWAVIGGFAVNVRIAGLHRITNDVDAVSADPLRLVEVLVGLGAQRTRTAELVMGSAGTEVMIDVLADGYETELPAEAGARAFALARRMAISDATPVLVEVARGAETVAAATVPVASTDSLIALKAAALPRRQGTRTHPKVGSDIHDMTRLVRLGDDDAVVAGIGGFSVELLETTGRVMESWFASGDAVEHAFARLRAFDQSDEAQTVTIEELGGLGGLGQRMIESAQVQTRDRRQPPPGRSPGL